ncbi:protein of unknown function [Limnospira indica PCC 8005]|uniref:Uncharacterized protein n=1 Tax=Limnospira indica PCC 8005 TaxID=376219 RepID=A0A9P1KFM7_9CYAN|nr:protein of unknown function [Limnospira indica PCC 8005]
MTLSIPEPCQRNPESLSLFVIGKDGKSLLELDGVCCRYYRSNYDLREFLQHYREIAKNHN